MKNPIKFSWKKLIPIFNLRRRPRQLMDRSPWFLAVLFLPLAWLARSTPVSAPLLAALALLCASGWSKLLRARRRLSRERRILEQKQRQLTEARREAIEIVTQDLRAPLTEIDLNLALLRRQLGRQDLGLQTEKMLFGLLKAAKTARTQLQRMLCRANMEAEPLELQSEPANLSDILYEAKDVFDPLAERKDIQLQVEIEKGIPKVVLDARKMQQAISNLLANAIKFTPLHGQVRLQARRARHAIHIIVSDTGIGIPQEQMTTLFEKFWKRQETRLQGSGLGLWIAKAIVEAHRGLIQVESELGKGTTFHVYLPI